ncbi:MAG TPA: histidine kinase [Flavobacterium sp.]|nr:histidine kinase [Flavobacterium sp.]
MKQLLIEAPLLLFTMWWTGVLWTTVILTLGTTAAFYIYRTSRERKALQELLAEQELKALRAQLNPHMLQNSFEIMASRILHQNADSAIAFIRQVSAYLRFLLHVNDKSKVTLEEELEFTEKYLALQQAIANGAFQYDISIDDNIDTYGIDVPFMLLQPVVENSIRHGYKNTAGSQLIISISLEARDEEIVCRISDNGIGLSNNGHNTGHISKGLMLTIKRLELLYRKCKTRPYMEVKSNQSGGVTTIIKIPLI